MAEAQGWYVRPEELAATSGWPQDTTAQRLLTEFLRNPFLDGDETALGIRLGMAQQEVAAALDRLCREGFLQAAGTRGYALKLAPPPPAAAPEEEPAAELPAAADLDAATVVSAMAAAAPASAHPSDEAVQTDESTAFQEELYRHLLEKLVVPLQLVEQHLDDPQAVGLGPARAAMAQINWFLQDIHLTGGPPPEA